LDYCEVRVSVNVPASFYDFSIILRGFHKIWYGHRATKHINE